MKIEQNILDVIDEGHVDGDLYYLPKRILDRATYKSVNKVLVALGGAWNKGLKAHQFGKTGVKEAIDNVLLTGSVIEPKKEFGFFETPPNIVKKLIGLADIQPIHRCLEPSAGTGNIADTLQDLTTYKVTCVEVIPESLSMLVSKGYRVFGEDFLQWESNVQFDRIVMNPPFRLQADIKHVAKAIMHLAPKGILVSVLSAGSKCRSNGLAIKFKELLNQYHCEWFELPSGAFKSSGTMVNTVILKVTN